MNKNLLLLAGVGAIGAAVATGVLGGGGNKQIQPSSGGGGGGPSYIVKKSIGAPTGSTAAKVPTIKLPAPEFPKITDYNPTKKEQTTSGTGGGGGNWRINYAQDTTANQLGATYNPYTNIATLAGGGVHDYNKQMSYWNGGTKKEQKATGAGGGGGGGFGGETKKEQSQPSIVWNNGEGVWGFFNP